MAKAWMVAVTAGLAMHGVAFAVQPAPATREEVTQLLARLGSSGCTFQRNGSWHSATEAQAHLDKKYRYLVDKGKLGRTEDFIDLAATRSSMTGTPYMVKCANKPLVTSASWLGAQLKDVRAGER